MITAAESAPGTGRAARPIDRQGPSTGRGLVPASVTGQGGTLFSARGRIGVRTYWARLFGGALMVLLATSAGGLVFRLAGGASETVHLGLGVGALVGFLPVLMLSILWTVQRVHDLGLHGAFVLLCLVPVIGIAFGLYAVLAPGRVGDTRFGAPRPPTAMEAFLANTALWVAIGYFVAVNRSGFLAGT